MAIGKGRALERNSTVWPAAGPTLVCAGVATNPAAAATAVRQAG